MSEETEYEPQRKRACENCTDLGEGDRLTGLAGWQRRDLAFHRDCELYVKAFSGVTNAAHVFAQLKAAKIPSPDNGSLTYVNGDLICDLLQVVVAVEQALRHKYGTMHRMKSNTLSSEVLCCLSLSNKIIDCLRQVGLNESVQSIVAILVVPLGTDITEHVALTDKLIQCEAEARPVGFNCSLPSVEKLYKLPAGKYSCPAEILPHVINKIVSKDLFVK